MQQGLILTQPEPNHFCGIVAKAARLGVLVELDAVVCHSSKSSAAK